MEDFRCKFYLFFHGFETFSLYRETDIKTEVCQRTDRIMAAY